MRAALVLLAIIWLSGCDDAPGASTSPSSVAPEPQWDFNQATDKMSGKTTASACIESIDKVHLEFPYGDNPMQLCFWGDKAVNHAELRLNGHGQFLCAYGCGVKVKVGNGAPKPQGASEAGDGSTDALILSHAAALAQSASKADLMISATLFQGGSQAVTFKTAGFKWAAPSEPPKG